ncbi:hypothetical protein V1387_12680 [Allomuricauda taeanensis]|uniref:hypothetical protein n=1 Tax=Flagellimonas taeanensis TaxID=1005926 RepID=UPI002E7C2704|nr:hypothetical protein [Allomuricauda taeanensis]MEE1963545.1 hypothetical protein [Allomuricauda taeanensis]
MLDPLEIKLIDDNFEVTWILIFQNKVYRDNGYYTEWETEGYPLLKIVHDDDHYYTTTDDIEVLSGNFTEQDLEFIAYHFNAFIDTFLNRPVKLNLRISREKDDIPFEHGLVTFEFYSYDGQEFILRGKQKTLINNIHGFVQISHVVTKEFNDRFLKISELEISLKGPKNGKRNEKIFSESVEYLDSNGIVLANSNSEDCPYVDIKVAHINQKLIAGLDLNGELFIGEIL